MDFLLELGVISAARKQNLCFLAEVEGAPGAAALLSMHDGAAVRDRLHAEEMALVTLTRLAVWPEPGLPPAQMRSSL